MFKEKSPFENACKTVALNHIIAAVQEDPALKKLAEAAMKKGHQTLSEVPELRKHLLTYLNGHAAAEELAGKILGLNYTDVILRKTTLRYFKRWLEQGSMYAPATNEPSMSEFLKGLVVI